ncbi:protein kinase [Streptomyces sp. NPDC086080]|uniref:serine/threonine-protein kinase n=1 Tax=Streptomyces sp. NPDC086080 TaxID=3365748 RepID=UPI0037D4875A
MGRVWRAADEILDRQVAVKEMRVDGLDAEDSGTRRERTLREARATARIDHPHVVRVYDVVDEGERLWIVMELVAGRSLERIIAEDGPLDPRATARIGLGLLAALRQVHARGVLHRDIKPGNVLVEEAEGRRTVLTDFGIAAIQDAKALTMVGMLVGSPDYMAPERVSGRPQGPPSDLWSLGATLCAALAGHSPFTRATTLATLHAVLYEPPDIPPSAGPLRDILTALLHKDPGARPTLDVLRSTLTLIAHPPPTPTLPSLLPPTAPTPLAPDPPGAEGEPGAGVRGSGQGEPDFADGGPRGTEPRAEEAGSIPVPVPIPIPIPGTRDGADASEAGGPGRPEHADGPDDAGLGLERSGRGGVGGVAEPGGGPLAPGPGVAGSAPRGAESSGPGGVGGASAPGATGGPASPEPGDADPGSHELDPVPEASGVSGQRPAPEPGALQTPETAAGRPGRGLAGPGSPVGAESYGPGIGGQWSGPGSGGSGPELGSALEAPEAAGGRPGHGVGGPGSPVGGGLYRGEGLGAGSPDAPTGGESYGPGAGPQRSETGSAGSGPEPWPVKARAGTGGPGGEPEGGTGGGGVPVARRGRAAAAAEDVELARALTERRPVPLPEGGTAPDGAVAADRSRAGRRRRRRAMVAAAAAGVAAVAVAVVLVATAGETGRRDRAGASASAPSVTGTPSPTVEGTSRPATLPPGARREAGGFAWAPPDGWRRDVQTGAEIHYTSPDGSQELAAKSSLARGDLLETWQTSERNAHQGQDYVKIRLGETTFRGHPAVIWEYTFTLKGLPWHARLLGFNVDGTSYQINTWYRPETGAAALKTYERVKKSFTVL